MTTGEQFVSLLILGIPVACVTWTVTHEEVFHELRAWCLGQSKNLRSIYGRKFFYLLTCEYCFSHYVSGLFILITRFHLLYGGWRGYLISWLSLVWIANAYMSLFGRLRLDIKRENMEIATSQKSTQEESAPNARETVVHQAQ